MKKFESCYEGGFPSEVMDYMLWQIHDDLMEQLNDGGNTYNTYVDARFMMKLLGIFKRKPDDEK